MTLLPVALALAIPREQVLDNAALYAAHAWTSTADNQHADCTDGDYESEYPPGDYVGLPYDWGGYVTLDEFDDQIAAGQGAGSHSWHGVLACTTGVDCSGFVSKVWETGHYGTSSFVDGPADAIEWSALTRADALNDAGSHMVLYTHETDAGWPVFYEASGSAGKVRINATSGWSYLDGFEPIRFESIEDGPSTGTAGAPREIAAFPFHDFRWTAGAASDTIDTYACAPDADESGPEVLYHFEAATAGTLAVVVSDDAGVDVDVHVLTAARGDACLARDDTDLTVSVDPGDVWISVDSYVGSGEFPGPYVLSATFEAGVADADPLADTGDSAGIVDTDATRPLARRAQLLRGEEEAGCGCAAGGGGGPTGIAALLGLLALRRRRSPASHDASARLDGG